MEVYLNSAITQFTYYKKLGEKTFAQLNDADLFWHFNAESNSIAIIIKHLSGNMLSRWTNFLISDGEKEWRNRDAEFEETINTREELMAAFRDAAGRHGSLVALAGEPGIGKTTLAEDFLRSVLAAGGSCVTESRYMRLRK